MKKTDIQDYVLKVVMVTQDTEIKQTKEQQMTTDPNWLKSITESYKQEISESARNLQEEADEIMNLVETIQTALNVDLTEAQVDALIEAFRSTIDPKTGEHKAGLIRKVLGVLGSHVHPTTQTGKNPDGTTYSSTGFGSTAIGTFGKISKENAKKQTEIHKANDAYNDDRTKENSVIFNANKSQDREYDRGTDAGLLMPKRKDFKYSEYKPIKYGD